MKSKDDDVLDALLRIEDKLQEIADILKMGHRESIDATKRSVLAGSKVKQEIYDLCDGKNSVGQIAKTLDKKIQQISNNLVLLEKAGLIKEIKRGNSKFYVKKG